MGNYIKILNWDKKQYIGEVKVQRYWDLREKKFFTQQLLELLASSWKGNKIGAYCEMQIDEMIDNEMLDENFYDKDKSEWKDITGYEDRD